MLATWIDGVTFNYERELIQLDPEVADLNLITKPNFWCVLYQGKE